MSPFFYKGEAMEIKEIISTVDVMRPNNKITTEQKIKWLSDIDGQIYNELIETREDNEISYKPYTEVNDTLIIPPPYTNTYVFYVLAQMDMQENEIGKYNNDISMFDTEYTAFRNYYNQKHKALRTRAKWY